MAVKKAPNAHVITSKADLQAKPWRILSSVVCGLSVLLLALVVHWYQEQQDSRVVPLPPLPPRNQTTFVRTTRQSFLERSPEREFSCAFEMKLASELESVMPVMNHGDNRSRLTNNQIFIMLNGGRFGFIDSHFHFFHIHFFIIFKYSNIHSPT